LDVSVVVGGGVGEALEKGRGASRIRFKQTTLLGEPRSSLCSLSPENARAGGQRVRESKVRR
jgi:hypothetical protein